MRRTFCFLPTLLVGLALFVSTVAAQPTPQLEYVESVTGGADPASPLPMLVMIHGLGDRPERFLPVFESLSIRARLIAPRAPLPAGDGGTWYPIDDPARRDAGIMAAALQVAELIDVVTRARPTLGKPVVTGFSQGGVLSFALAAYYSDKLAAAVPLAGSLPVDVPPPPTAARGFVVRAFHGQTDARIPYKDGLRTVAWLKRAKLKATMRGYPGVGHALTAKMQEQAKLEIGKLLTATAKRGVPVQQPASRAKP